jgi:ankyrin repeat protein
MNAPNLANININVKAIDYDGKSILHVGAREGAYEIVKCILENGGEEIVNAIDRF